MNLTNLKPAADYEVKEWLETELELSQHQKSLLYHKEIIRWSPFDFYKDRDKEKSPALWRLTLPFLPIYLLLLVIVLPFKFMLYGKWGYSQKFVDRFYHSWLRKLNI